MQNSVFINLAVVLCGHAMVTWGGGGGGGPTPLYGQYGKCAAGQSTVTEKNLATLDTNLSHSVLNNRLPNNTQITTNNISGLLCRSRPLRFIDDQLSLKNRTVKNNHRIHQGKLNGVLDTYSTRDTRRPGKNRYKSPPRDGKKNRGNLGRDQAKKFHDLPTK